LKSISTECTEYMKVGTEKTRMKSSFVFVVPSVDDNKV